MRSAQLRGCTPKPARQLQRSASASVLESLPCTAWCSDTVSRCVAVLGPRRTHNLRGQPLLLRGAVRRRPVEQSLQTRGRPRRKARLRAERARVRAGNPPAAPLSARSPHQELHRSLAQLHREQAALRGNDFAFDSRPRASSWPMTCVTRCAKRSRSERSKSRRSPAKTDSTVGIVRYGLQHPVERSPLHHAANGWEVDRPKRRHSKPVPCVCGAVCEGRHKRSTALRRSHP